MFKFFVVDRPTRKAVREPRTFKTKKEVSALQRRDLALIARLDRSRSEYDANRALASCK